MRESKRPRFDAVVQLVLYVLSLHLAIKFMAFTYLQTVQWRWPTVTDGHHNKLTSVSDEWNFEQRPVALQTDNNLRYGLFASPEWSALVPGDGRIYLGEDHQPAMVSMFHQLHCIDVVRSQLALPRLHRNAELAQHCMNYLRQMLLCRGDSFLDPYQYPSRIHGVDKNPIRQCWDWEVVYKAAIENQEEHARWLNDGRYNFTEAH